MAAPRPKKTVVKKKPPVKKKPSFLRKDTPRPARDIKPGDLRSQTLANDNKPLYDKKIGPKKPSVGSTLTRGFLKKAPVIGTAIGFIADASPAGTGSTVSGQAQKAVEKKMKREIRQGPELAVTGVKVGSYRNYGEKIGPKKPKASVIMPKASMAGGGVNKPGGKSFGNTSKVGGPGGARALTDGKSSAASTAATSAAASGRKRPPTRYQRNELAMEQRKRSSSGQRKSILSLFRKG